MVNSEINNMKEFYENQIEQTKQEGVQVVEFLKNENDELKQKIEELTAKNFELSESNRSTLPKSISGRNALSRRNSDGAPLLKTKLGSDKATSQYNGGHNQYLEDESLKSDKYKVKTEQKLETQKKLIQDLKNECEDLKQDVSDQKSKRQKEITKNKDMLKKMERDMKNLKRDMDTVHKENSELKRNINFKETADRQTTRSSARGKLNMSRDVSRSHGDKGSLQNVKLNGSLMNRKSIQMNRKDNPMFSSTTSMKSFNLLKTYRKISKKDSQNLNMSNMNDTSSSMKGKAKISEFVEESAQGSDKHKTCSHRGICSIGHKHGRTTTDTKPYLKRKLNSSSTQDKAATTASQQVKDMCQLMVDNASRLECNQCCELYIPTEFLEHVTSDEPCKDGLWKKETHKSDNKEYNDNSSPVIKNQKSRLRNKENSRIEEMNPVSERSSLMSLRKSKMSPTGRQIVKPPHKNMLKDRNNSNAPTLSYDYRPNGMGSSESMHNVRTHFCQAIC